MSAESQKVAWVDIDNLASNMTPDGTVAVLMLTCFMELLVDKGIITRDEVSDVSIRLGEVLHEIGMRNA